MDFYLSEEQKMIQETARKFAQNELAPKAAEVDASQKFPRKAWESLSGIGLAGVTVPEQYGGSGMSFLTAAVVMEEIAGGCMATAGTLSVHLTTEYLVSAFGSEEQKQQFLPRMAQGKIIGALALTEPGAGSDASSIVTTAVRDGKDYTVNGNKIFITTGGEADLYVLYAKTNRELKHKGISAFLVEKETAGLAYGKKENKMGYGGSPTRELIFDDCRIPSGYLLGMEGAGFTMVMSGLDHGRITVGASAVGIAETALHAALKYSQERKQFGQAICSFQGIQWKFADMVMEIEAARLLIYKAAFLAERNFGFTKEASIGKCFATDMCMRVTTDAVQILGGYGYMKEYQVERYMRDAKILQIVEGTNEIQRNVIARELLSKH